MKQLVVMCLILSVCAIGAWSAADAPLYTVGIQEGADQYVSIAYVPVRCTDAGALSEVLAGKATAAEIADDPLSKAMAQVGELTVTRDMTVAGLPVKPGKYPIGFAAEAEGKVNLTLGVGAETCQAEVVFEHHTTNIPMLAMMLAPAREGHALYVLFGEHFATIPVTAGIVEAAVCHETEGEESAEIEEAAETEAAAVDAEDEGTDEEGADDEDLSWEDIATESFSGY